MPLPLELELVQSATAKAAQPEVDDPKLTRLHKALRERGKERVVFVRNAQRHPDYFKLLAAEFIASREQLEKVFKIVDEEYDGKLTSRIGKRNNKGSIVLWPTDHLKKAIPLKRGFDVISDLTPRRTLEEFLRRYMPPEEGTTPKAAGH
jgi:hypothetical protein